MQVDEEVPPATSPVSGAVELLHDRELLGRIHCNSSPQADRAMEELLSYCQQVITPYVHRRLAASDDRLTVIQNTCLYIIEHVHSFVFQDKPLRHWFISVAEFKVKEQFRELRRGRSRVVESDLAVSYQDGVARDDSPFDRLNAPETRATFQARRYHNAPDPGESPLALPGDLTAEERDRLIHAALAGLPDVERRILMLIYFGEETSSTEIGRLLALPPGTVRQYHRRALGRLRRLSALQRLFDDLSLY